MPAPPVELVPPDVTAPAAPAPPSRPPIPPAPACALPPLPLPPVPGAPPAGTDASLRALQTPAVHCVAATTPLQSLFALHGTSHTRAVLSGQLGWASTVAAQVAIALIVVHDERSVHGFVQTPQMHSNPAEQSEVDAQMSRKCV